MATYSFPNVTFTEFIQGAAAVTPQGLNRAVAVGTSKRGPLGDVILISTDTQLDDRIGRDLSTGSVGLQAARAEGATDTGFVRVLGAAKSASASFTIGGVASNIQPTETVTLSTPTLVGGVDAVAAKATVVVSGGMTEGNTASITVDGGTPYVYNVLATDTSISVASKLALLINAGAGDAKVVASASGSTLTLTAKTAGLSGNSLTVVATPAIGAGAALTLALTTNGTFSGGANAVTAAATATIGGTVRATDRVRLIFTTGTVSRTYTYQVVQGDTLATIAASLVTRINANGGDSEVLAAVDSVDNKRIRLTAKASGVAANGVQLASLVLSSSSFESLTLTVIAGTSVRNYTINLTPGQTGLSIDTSLVQAVNADALAAVVASYDAATDKITLVAKEAGVVGNSISYGLQESGDMVVDLVINPITGNLTGGIDGPRRAQVALGDLTLVAIGEGSDGNFIKYSMVPGTTAGTRELTLTNSDGKSETLLLSFTQDDLINGNELVATATSITIRAYLPANANLNALNIPLSGSGFLSGGQDGPPVTEDDYINAIRLLGTKRANYIFAPGQASNGVRQALLAQAHNATILQGLRIAVLNAPRALTAETAPAAAVGYDSSDPTTGGSAVMVAGWCTFSLQPRLPQRSVSPDGFYVGALARTPEHVSPAARTSSPFFNTIVDVDTQNLDSDFEAYTQARLEAIVLDPVTNSFHRLNGRTLASNQALYYVSIRRMANRIKTDLFFATQALKSEPKTDNLSNSLSNLVNSYLANKAAEGTIKTGSILDINSVGARLRVNFQWYPLYPADQIDYGMYRLATDV